MTVCELTFNEFKEIGLNSEFIGQDEVDFIEKLIDKGEKLEIRLKCTISGDFINIYKYDKKLYRFCLFKKYDLQ